MSLNEDGKEGMIELLGIFPGAEVVKGSLWPYGREVNIMSILMFFSLITYLLPLDVSLLFWSCHSCSRRNGTQ